MRSTVLFTLAVLALALALAALSPFASENPDGLDSVAQTVGLPEGEARNPFPAPLPDYGGSDPTKKVVSGTLGTLLSFAVLAGLGAGLGRLARRRRAGAGTAGADPGPQPPGVA